MNSMTKRPLIWEDARLTACRNQSVHAETLHEVELEALGRDLKRVRVHEKGLKDHLNATHGTDEEARHRLQATKAMKKLLTARLHELDGLHMNFGNGNYIDDRGKHSHAPSLLRVDDSTVAALFPPLPLP